MRTNVAATIAIIQGTEEREKKEVQIKDLIEGKRLSQHIKDNVTWRTTRPAQITVAVADLVEKVQKQCSIFRPLRAIRRTKNELRNESETGY